MGGKIGPNRDGINIFEDRFVTERLHEVIIDAPCRRWCILAPIADKDRRHAAPSSLKTPDMALSAVAQYVRWPHSFRTGGRPPPYSLREGVTLPESSGPSHCCSARGRNVPM